MTEPLEDVDFSVVPERSGLLEELLEDEGKVETSRQKSDVYQTSHPLLYKQ